MQLRDTWVCSQEDPSVWVSSQESTDLNDELSFATCDI